MTGSPGDRLIVALDVPDLESAKRLVGKLSPAVRIFKVGKELFTACGPDVVRMVHDGGAKVFLDLKFHDIPNTVASACRSAAKLGVFMMNVHACGGRKMMEEAVRGLHEVSDPGPRPILLAVTVLTSLTGEEIAETGVPGGVEAQVERLALLAKSSGVSGVVASPKEIGLIRRIAGDRFVIVTPGVRPAWAEAGDQKRVLTPKEAIQAGADYIVVGRPVTRDADPLGAAKKVIEEIR